MRAELIDEAIVALGIAHRFGVHAGRHHLTVVLGRWHHREARTRFRRAVDAAIQSRVIAGLPVKVVAAALGDDAGVVGAASLFD